MGSRYHVKVDGVGFLVGAGSYRRFAPGRVEGKPWTVTDWRRGDGHPVAGEAGGFRAGFGVEIGAAGRLSLAPGVAASLATGDATYAGMAPFLGKLYVVCSASGAVSAFDGAAWTVPYTAPATLRSLGQAYGELMIGAADGKVYSWDPVANVWGLRFTVAAAGEVTAVIETTVNEPVTGGFQVARRSVFGLSKASGSGKMVAIDAGATTTLSMDVGESRVEAMANYRGKLYLATSWGSAASGGRLLAYGLRGGTTFWDLTEAAAFSDAAPVSLVVADGLLWLGMASGCVMAWDGTRVVEAVDLASRGVAAPGQLRGLANLGERVCMGYAHPAQGAALMVRQPAAVSGAAFGLAGARDGWVMESASGVAGTVSALGVYGGTVLFWGDTAAGATIYLRRLDAWRTSGEVELGSWDGGDPSAVKVLDAVFVGHDALRAGESVRVSYSLDGGGWTVLGSSATVGSAFATLAWSGVVVCRRLELKAELLSVSAALGPALTGLTLAHTLAGSGKRHWRFDARCEGVPGVPLRLLDGSMEPMFGTALSGCLWTAYGAGVVAFEDLDGVVYQVLFRSLEEDPGKLPQDRGAQMAARCELVEW